jgi:predicted transposase/invertase (TIGR01784 family)
LILSADDFERTVNLESNFATTCCKIDLDMAKAKSRRKKGKQHNSQINQYDKIFRENLEAALPGLIKNLLGIQAVHTEELPDDIQHTKERKPDVLKKVTDKNGETFVLHIEFQVKDELEMVFRMAEYYIMLLRQYQLQVRQYVIYIGAGDPAMTDHIRSESMNFKYRLIVLSAVDYQLLLRSENPEEKMLAILADFGGGDPKRIIENIVNQVITATKGDFSKLRYIQQLRILAQLRNLAIESLQIMDSIANYISEEKDILYRRGERDGIEKGKETVVKILLLNTDFTVAKIAALSDVTEAFVKKVKKTLK